MHAGHARDAAGRASAPGWRPVLVVREDSLTLFGFATDDERAVFETLQGVTGVGPRLAQAVLAAHSPDAVRAAVATDDVGALTLVPGIGRKGAQRLVLELKDKLGAAGERRRRGPAARRSRCRASGATSCARR